MANFGRFDAGKDSGPPSVGDEDADWKRADFIRVIQDASRPAGWRGAARFQPGNDTQQTPPKGYPEGHEEDMRYGEIPIGPGKSLRTISGAIEQIPTVTGEVLPGIEEAWKALKNIAKLPGEDAASFARRKLLTERNFKANKIIEERLGGADETLGKFAEARKQEFLDAAQAGQDSARRGLAKVQEVQNKLYETKDRVAKFAEDWTGESGKANIRRIMEESKKKYWAEQAAKEAEQQAAQAAKQAAMPKLSTPASTPNTKLPTPATATPKKPIDWLYEAVDSPANKKRLVDYIGERSQFKQKIAEREAFFAEKIAAKDKIAQAAKAREDYRIEQAARRHEQWLADQAETQRLQKRSLFEKIMDTLK